MTTKNRGALLVDGPPSSSEDPAIEALHRLAAWLPQRARELGIQTVAAAEMGAR